MLLTRNSQRGHLQRKGSMELVCIAFLQLEPDTKGTFWYRFTTLPDMPKLFWQRSKCFCYNQICGRKVNSLWANLGNHSVLLLLTTLRGKQQPSWKHVGHTYVGRHWNKNISPVVHIYNSMTHFVRGYSSYIFCMRERGSGTSGPYL